MNDEYQAPVRILVADDEDKILEMYKSIFSSRGKPVDSELSRMENELFGEAHQVEEDAYTYDLTLCKQGDEAVERVRESIRKNQPYALAVLDIRMPPGPNGVWTAEQVRKLDPNINILIVTGYSDFDPEEIARLVPPVDKILYVHKPLHPAETRAFTTAICAKWISETNQRDLNQQLEERVEERNRELIASNNRLEQEIAARREQQVALEKSEQYLKTLLNTVRCGILVIDAESLEIKDANPFAMELLGAELEKDVIGCPCPLFLTLEPDGAGSPEPAPEPRAEANRENLNEGTLRTIRGATLNVLMSSAILNAGNESLQIVSFIDITANKLAEKEQLRLEEQLRQAHKMEAIGQLAGGTAHDFNNILQAILGHSDLVMERIEDGSEIANSIEQIKSASMRAAELVQQILTFSRHTTGEHRTFPLQHVIKETLKLLRATLPTTITINTDVDERCPPITADWTELQQVLLNLCTNAHQAMLHTGGELTIRLAETEVDEEMASRHMDLSPATYALLSIEDTGVGMNDETRKRIFDPYFTTKGLGRGTGLGLSTVYGIVQSISGAVHVHSVEGEGSRFEIYIPVSGEPIEVPEEEPEEELDLGGSEEHLMFVDDEEMLVEIAVKRLTRLGYRVKGFTDSREALAYFEAKADEVDLVITDQTMPTMTGAALAQAIRDIRPSAPIILCTGFSETIDETTALEMGIAAFLYKPVSEMELSRTIRRALEKAQTVS